MDLTQKKCVPCEVGAEPMDAATVAEYAKNIPMWNVTDNKLLTREFKFKDFKESMQFVLKVAELAEAEGHHPDMYIFYNVVRLELSTHAVKGLSENDFILAAKIDPVV